MEGKYEGKHKKLKTNREKKVDLSLEDWLESKELSLSEASGVVVEMTALAEG